MMVIMTGTFGCTIVVPVIVSLLDPRCSGAYVRGNASCVAKADIRRLVYEAQLAAKSAPKSEHAAIQKRLRSKVLNLLDDDHDYLECQ